MITSVGEADLMNHAMMRAKDAHPNMHMTDEMMKNIMMMMKTV